MVNAIYVDLPDSTDSKSSSNGSAASTSVSSSSPSPVPLASSSDAASLDVKRILDDVIENVTGVKREQPLEQQQQQQHVRSVLLVDLWVIIISH